MPVRHRRIGIVAIASTNKEGPVCLGSVQNGAVACHNAGGAIGHSHIAQQAGGAFPLFFTESPSIEALVRRLVGAYRLGRGSRYSVTKQFKLSEGTTNVAIIRLTETPLPICASRYHAGDNDIPCC